MESTRRLIAFMLSLLIAVLGQLQQHYGRACKWRTNYPAFLGTLGVVNNAVPPPKRFALLLKEILPWKRLLRLYTPPLVRLHP